MRDSRRFSCEIRGDEDERVETEKANEIYGKEEEEATARLTISLRQHWLQVRSGLINWIEKSARRDFPVRLRNSFHRHRIHPVSPAHEEVRGCVVLLFEPYAKRIDG